MLYIYKGNEITPVEEENLVVKNSLEVRNYLVTLDNLGFHLIPADNFVITEKTYGNTPCLVERFLTTYRAREGNLGILLSGEKGSGKSRCAKLLSIEAARNNIPTIIINQPYTGDVFNKFIQSINCEALLMFDEFNF